MTAPWSDEVPVPVTVARSRSPAQGPAHARGSLRKRSASATSMSMGIVSSMSVAGCSTPPRSWCAKASRCPRSWPQAVSCSQVWTRWRRCSWSLSSPTSSTASSGPPPPHEVARLAETIERLRPIARTALDAEFGRAMDRRARVTYDEFIRLLAAGDRRAGAPAHPAHQENRTHRGHLRHRVHQKGKPLRNSHGYPGRTSVRAGSASPTDEAAWVSSSNDASNYWHHCRCSGSRRHDGASQGLGRAGRRGHRSSAGPRRVRRQTAGRPGRPGRPARPRTG